MQLIGNSAPVALATDLCRNRISIMQLLSRSHQVVGEPQHPVILGIFPLLREFSANMLRASEDRVK